jgi:hypothetical protein
MPFNKDEGVCSLILIVCPMEMDGVSVGTKMNTNESISGDCGRVRSNAGAGGSSRLVLETRIRSYRKGGSRCHCTSSPLIWWLSRHGEGNEGN